MVQGTLQELKGVWRIQTLSLWWKFLCGFNVPIELTAGYWALQANGSNTLRNVLTLKSNPSTSTGIVPIALLLLYNMEGTDGCFYADMPLINSAASLYYTSNNSKTPEPSQTFLGCLRLLLLEDVTVSTGCEAQDRLPMWQRYLHSRARKEHEAKVVHSRIKKFLPSTANTCLEFIYDTKARHIQ